MHTLRYIYVAGSIYCTPSYTTFTQSIVCGTARYCTAYSARVPGAVLTTLSLCTLCGLIIIIQPSNGALIRIMLMTKRSLCQFLATRFSYELEKRHSSPRIKRIKRITQVNKYRCRLNALRRRQLMNKMRLLLALLALTITSEQTIRSAWTIPRYAVDFIILIIQTFYGRCCVFVTGQIIGGTSLF